MATKTITPFNLVKMATSRDIATENLPEIINSTQIKNHNCKALLWLVSHVTHSADTLYKGIYNITSKTEQEIIDGLYQLYLSDIITMLRAYFEETDGKTNLYELQVFAETAQAIYFSLCMETDLPEVLEVLALGSSYSPDVQKVIEILESDYQKYTKRKL